MKMKPYAAGLILPCLMILSGCVSAPPSPGPQIIVNGCPRVTACLFPSASPRTNGDLNDDIDQLEAALHACAAQVDTVLACQQGTANVKT
ncbi:Rz1-like lysis system protein LysC [Yersinia mollaretii]|nr:Rz1-like lysis system protein LysC [Yersinia mollaretii]MDA5526885.1 Rz1-like lysis system protein LysC [Yersinia mollaretii]MDR7872280.1 Rz1-like lysis system protein LysC [Yersinia mollaretii]WQC73204.1 Rz1-like lysis system protein LysC [Yersinia mollaretii]